MKISLQQLHDMKACQEGIERFQLQTNGTLEPVDVATLVGGHNTYSDLLWLVGNKFSRERIARLACDCALINIELIKPYTDEYDLIVNWLNNPTAATYAAAAAAAAYAADAAYTAYTADAARVARAAAYAADAAAYAARVARVARAAAYAADAADAAARAAAYAADAAARAKVNALLVQLFNEVD